MSRALDLVVGQLIVGGFEGTSLPASFDAALRRGHRAGAILFRRNLPTLDVTRALVLAIRLAAREASELLPIVSIDEEGGRVTRLPESTPLPAMRELGRLGDDALTRRAGRAVGQKLAALGFTLDFAPILDVDSNPKNPVIGDRAFHQDAHRCATSAIAFAEGLNEGGVLACGKHFPGHGDTDVDSHFTLPTIRHERARLDAVELVPFREAARAKLDSFMTAHLVATALDDRVPATLSKAISTDLLRHTLGFEGALFSDDLEMKAVADARSVEENAVLSIEAGCDTLLICRSEELQERAFAALLREAESNPAFKRRCDEASQRILALRRRATAMKPAAPTPEVWDEIDARLKAARQSTRPGSA